MRTFGRWAAKRPIGARWESVEHVTPVCKGFDLMSAGTLQVFAGEGLAPVVTKGLQCCHTFLDQET